jgi:hypothetical protein
LFGQPTASPVGLVPWLIVPSRSDTVDVVGEAQCQDALLRIARGRTEDGPTKRSHVAQLVAEPANRYDRNAISVRIEGQHVGYLERADAIAYGDVVRRAATLGRTIALEARLIGGWDRGGDDVGSIGVQLHLGPPADCLAALEAPAPAAPRARAASTPQAGPPVRTDHRWVGQVIAFTGASMYRVDGVLLDRSSSEMWATSAGMVVHPRVTKAVALLVDCDPRTVSRNERKATNYGVPVVSEHEFWTTIGLPIEDVGWSDE